MNALSHFNALDEVLKGKIRGPLSPNSFNNPRPLALLTGPSVLPAYFSPVLCVAKGRGQHLKAVVALLAAPRRRSAVISLTQLSIATCTF